MLSYPVILEKDDDTLLVTSPDFPELTTFGMDRREAIQHARDALAQVIAGRISFGEVIPQPSTGETLITVSEETENEIRSYWKN